MGDVLTAIKKIRPNALVSVKNNDINEITWIDNNPTNITTQQIQNELDKQTNQINNPESLLYSYTRKKEYPSIGEQLDSLWHDIDNNTVDKTGAFYNLIKNIKTSFPKE